jgi:hypothetical protein
MDESTEQKTDQASERPVAIGGVEPLKEGTRSYAYVLGKRVTASLKEIGAPVSSIESSRKRMMAWIDMLESYEKSTKEVRSDERLSVYQRAKLLDEMYWHLEEYRRKSFGG